MITLFASNQDISSKDKTDVDLITEITTVKLFLQPLGKNIIEHEPNVRLNERSAIQCDYQTAEWPHLKACHHTLYLIAPHCLPDLHPRTLAPLRDLVVHV